MADIIGFLFFHPLLSWVGPRFRKLATSALDSIPRFFFLDDAPAPTTHRDVKTTALIISREEVETVMGKVGLPCDAVDGGMLGMEGICSMFEEEEPSLEEVKEAFDVFDDNKDGFVDANELQRVLLSVLGVKEGSSLEACERMIAAFDESKDGRIDFMKFVKLMERSFSC